MKDTYHRFLSEAAFLAACDAAGWGRGPENEPLLPEGVSVDVIGPLMTRPQVGAGGRPIPGDVLDPRFHVNARWPNEGVPNSFIASQINPAPETLDRVWSGYKPPGPALPPAVPERLPSWKIKAWLEQDGKLATVATAVKARGVVAEIAFKESSEWNRNSPRVAALAAILGMTSAEIDAAFIAADALQG